jgi:hypothetical protein
MFPLETERLMYHVPEQRNLQSLLVLELLAYISAMLSPLSGDKNAEQNHSLK